MSTISDHSFTRDLARVSFCQQNKRILKAIHNKLTPLNMSPKVRRIIDRQSVQKRPTFNEYSYFRSGKNLKTMITQCSTKGSILQPQKLIIVVEPCSISRNMKKSTSTIDLQAIRLSQSDTFNDMQKLKIQQRLPVIKKDLQKRKEQLAKSLHTESLHFQKDSFRAAEQGKPYNLQYVLNRLSVHEQKKKSTSGNKNKQNLRGYENLSPNNLKDYIECFKKKKINAQSIYVSKKRIALPRSNTEVDEEQQNLKCSRVQSIATCTDQTKLMKKSRRQINATQKSFCNQAASKKQFRKTFNTKK